MTDVIELETLLKIVGLDRYHLVANNEGYHLIRDPDYHPRKILHGRFHKKFLSFECLSNAVHSLVNERLINE
jgi:hypothetical protein